MQVLEYEDERAALRHRLEEATPRREAVVSAVGGEIRLPSTADEREQPLLHPIGVGVVAEQIGDRLGDARMRVSSSSDSSMPA